MEVIPICTDGMYIDSSTSPKKKLWYKYVTYCIYINLNAALEPNECMFKLSCFINNQVEKTNATIIRKRLNIVSDN